MKISFDFDSTLSEPFVQIIAEAMIRDGHDVYIITSRVSGASKHPDIWEVAEDLQIQSENIFFTDGALKTEIIKKLDINLHFDDMEDEVCDIKENSNCKTMLVNFDMNVLIACLKQELRNEKKGEDKLH